MGLDERNTGYLVVVNEGAIMSEYYIKYEPGILKLYPGYYIQFIFCGMVLLRKRGVK